MPPSRPLKIQFMPDASSLKQISKKRDKNTACSVRYVYSFSFDSHSCKEFAIKSFLCFI